MALRKRPLATGVAALVFSSWVAALGLGEIQLHSALNEPLDADIRLHNLGELTEDEILADLASAGEFTRAGLEREAILSELSFSLDLSNPAAPLLRVNSQRPIREPYLGFLVDVRWPSGRLLREYTLLLDLPIQAADHPLRSGIVDAPLLPQGQEQRAVTPSSAQQHTVAARHLPPLTAGGEYRVAPGETLWSIASRLAGSGSVHSKMVAIQQLNPGAFIDGDINQLRQGEVLRFPSGNEMADTRPQPSAEGHEPIGDEGASQGQLSGLKLSAVELDTVNENELPELSPAAGDGSATPIHAQLQDVQEELARTQRENHELRFRLVSLEDQFDTLQRLAEVGSDETGALQSMTGSQNAGGPDAEQGGVSGGWDGADTDAGAPAGEPVAASPPLPAVAPTPVQPQTNKGWGEAVSSYLVYILGAVAVVIAALVVVMLRHRREDGDEEDLSALSPTFNQQGMASAQPPVVPIQGETTAWSSVASFDDIVLDEEDDLFAAPAGQDAQDAASAQRPEPFSELQTLSLAGQSEVMDAKEEVELDLSEFELDDFPVEPPGQETTVPASLEEALSLDDFDFLGDADEGETQLGLAQAYLDMSDQGSAREILQEVLESGSEAHRARARTLLDSLG